MEILLSLDSDLAARATFSVFQRLFGEFLEQATFAESM